MSLVVRAEAGIDACLDTLDVQLRELAASPSPVADVSVWVRWYAFDVIGELFFSRPFGFLASRRDVGGWIQAGDTLSLIFTMLGFSPPWARPLLYVASALVPKVLRGVRSLGTMETAAEECIRQRREAMEKEGGGGGGRVDMLASFIRIMEEKGMEVDYGPVEVKSEIHTALWVALLPLVPRLGLTCEIARVVGSDTTSTAITAILYYLMKDRETYRKLLAEIDAATARGQLSVPHVQYSEAFKLPYLDACCKEGMRLLPSLGMALPRDVPPGGREIAGQFVPGGVTVGISATNLQRSREVFGEDADEFNPERWLRGDAANMEKHMLHVSVHLTETRRVCWADQVMC